MNLLAEHATRSTKRPVYSLQIPKVHTTGNLVQCRRALPSLMARTVLPWLGSEVPLHIH